MRRTIAVVPALVGGLLLTGCGGDAYQGKGTAACPDLPGDVVAAVAGDLSADGKGPEPNESRPQSGKLPTAPDSDGGVLYRCQWATTDGGTGLQVYVREMDERGIADDTAYLKAQTGPELSAPVSGYGRAIPDDDGPTARWACEGRELQMDLFTPKEGTDATAGAKRLAESLIPKIGCPA